MENFAFLLKSYYEDIFYVERILKSYNKFNVDLIKLYLVVPFNEISEFKKFESENIILLDEEQLSKHLVTEPINNIRPGYINQEIIKLSFWELELCKNYLCLDSDGVFLRNFFISDFMYTIETPYSILVEDNELKIEPEYYNTHWIGRDIQIKKIIKSIGLPIRNHYLTCHGFGIFSSIILKSLKDNFMRSNNFTYANLMEISPYEFSWYNIWLQFDKSIEIHVREPLFKYFHHRNHHLELIIKNINMKDLSRGYVGIVINSNYSRFMGVINFDEKKHVIIASYFRFNDIIKAIFFKINSKFNIFKNK